MINDTCPHIPRASTYGAFGPQEAVEVIDGEALGQSAVPGLQEGDALRLSAGVRDGEEDWLHLGGFGRQIKSAPEIPKCKARAHALCACTHDTRSTTTLS